MYSREKGQSLRTTCKSLIYNEKSMELPNKNGELNTCIYFKSFCNSPKTIGKRILMHKLMSKKRTGENINLERGTIQKIREG